MPTLRHLPAALAAVLALAAATTACAEGSGPSGTPQDPALEGSWSVHSLTADGKTLTAPPAARLSVEPGTDPHRAEASGVYGCNGFGDATVVYGTGSERSTITVIPGVTTAMACKDMAFETAFAKLFRGRLEVHRTTNGHLVLKASDGSTLDLVAQPPTHDAPLTATTWTVNGLVSGDTVASVPAGTEGRAVFTLGSDSTASGTLGCNRFSAPATVQGSRLTLGPLVTTRMACTGPAGDLERTLTELFGSGPLTWRIRDRTLTLTAADGHGLTAEAASAAE
ncbi:META domain-containing protein [Streptomyces sp. NPDC046876]|uniref:META domain-containing protein n=1 Tax=Streptomyces sp. NPDC046876 TaxID=3155616 RepID=UPI0033D9FC87